MRTRSLVVITSAATLVGFLATGAAGVQGPESPGSTPTSAHVGRQGGDLTLLPNGQQLTPFGRQMEMVENRVTSLAVSPDQRYAALHGSALVIEDLQTAKPVSSYTATGITSSNGTVWSADGTTIVTTTTDGNILVFPVRAGVLGTPKIIALPTSSNVNSSAQTADPMGLTLSADDTTAYVALSRSNTLAVVDLVAGTVTKEIAVANAPYGVVVVGTTAYVSDEGGRVATTTDSTNDSAGTNVVADPYNGGTATGEVTVVDLTSQAATAHIPVGLHPTGLTLHGSDLWVVNTSSDTLSVIDTASQKVTQTVQVTPFPQAPSGSQPTKVAFDNGHAYVSLGDSNAVAAYALTGSSTLTFSGLVPVGWFPSDLATYRDAAGEHLLVSNDKGVGTVADTDAGKVAKGLTETGSTSIVDLPLSADTLTAETAQVSHNNGWDVIDTACPSATAVPVAIPAHIGEPSLIKHVVYIIKENRSYDQVLGDVGRGVSDPALAQFGATVTPNQHALANQFSLFDNYYASPRRSNDGHHWAVQGHAPSYLEKGFSTRDDPAGLGVGTPASSGFDSLLYLPGGFIWEAVARAGKDFEDFGEFTVESMPPPARSDVPSLEAHVFAPFSGFELTTPDQYRAQLFKGELATHEAAGTLPALTLITLPDDHTGGSNPLYTTPESQVADNDAGTGEIIDAVSHSQFWKDTAVFVEEDDSQGGLDSVEGHRSVLFVASPYAKRGGTVDTTYYSQTNVVRTIEQILGAGPMSTADLAAAPIRSAFTDTPDLTPFTALPAETGTAIPNPPLTATTGVQHDWAVAMSKQDFRHSDAVDPELLNRDIWYEGHGWDVPYPGDDHVLEPSEVVLTPTDLSEDAEAGGDPVTSTAFGPAAAPAVHVPVATAPTAGTIGDGVTNTARRFTCIVPGSTGTVTVVGDPSSGVPTLGGPAGATVPAGSSAGTPAAPPAAVAAAGTLAKTGGLPLVGGAAFLLGGAALVRRRRRRG